MESSISLFMISTYLHDNISCCRQVDHHRRPSFKEILMVLMVLPQKAIRVQATALLLEDDDAYYNAIRMAQKPPKDSDTGLYSKLDRSK